MGKIGSTQRHQLKWLNVLYFSCSLLKKDLGVVAAQPLNWVPGVSVLEKLRRQVPCRSSFFFFSLKSYLSRFVLGRLKEYLWQYSSLNYFSTYSEQHSIAKLLKCIVVKCSEK